MSSPERRIQSRAELAHGAAADFLKETARFAMKTANSLTKREILALAIAMEEEDERVYADFAEAFRVVAPAWSSTFEHTRLEEAAHRDRLFALYRKQFGDHALHLPFFAQSNNQSASFGYLPIAKLRGHGVGSSKHISSAPMSAMFLVKLIKSTCFIWASSICQKLWILIETPSRKMINKVIPTPGYTPDSMLRPPSSRSIPVPATAAFGAGVPFAFAYSDM